MHKEGLSDEFRHNRAVARPRLQRFSAAAALLPVHFRQQALIDVRALL
jgi:hypothetical protein